MDLLIELKKLQMKYEGLLKKGEENVIELERRNENFQIQKNLNRAWTLILRDLNNVIEGKLNTLNSDKNSQKSKKIK